MRIQVKQVYDVGVLTRLSACLSVSKISSSLCHLCYHNTQDLTLTAIAKAKLRTLLADLSHVLLPKEENTNSA